MKRRALAFPFALAVLVAAAAFMVQGRWPWARLSDVPTANPIMVTSSFRLVRDTLQRGETVSAVLRRQGVTGLDFGALTRALHIDPRILKAGLVFSVRRDATTDEPTHVEFRPSPDQRLQFVRTAAGGWEGQTIPIHWTIDTIRIATTVDSTSSTVVEAIDHSPTAALLDHDSRMQLVYALADINGYSVDFRFIQRGDQFAMVAERMVSEEGDVRIGAFLASEVVSGGKTHYAYRYKHVDGESSFYDEQGHSLKRAFLLAPVDFRYVSSNFSRSRYQPILGLWRKHEGTDFVAPKGTPVRAAGDGTVTVAGWSGGYGNLVEIRHAGGITTRYGHLSHITQGVHPGTHVSQGDIVGLVGMTGLATGPHLHYEFRVNGIARDPRSVKGGDGAPLPTGEYSEFQRQRDLLSALLDRHITASNLITE